MQDIKDKLVQADIATAEKYLKGNVVKEKITTDEKNPILGRISKTLYLALAKDCDIIIKAIIENRQAKTERFRRLDELCPLSVIVVSNTSSIPITDLRPRRSGHRHQRISGETGKVPVYVKAGPGLLANRVIVALSNEVYPRVWQRSRISTKI
jgi:3-hydroxyacyl-CoA dehydrogenase